ncbi:hypothetical protein HMPREF0239_03305 [Clostridium sp. ATCC BAA-442]|nr:hypothetical protein HMPREF0239_03305 [Clostridium sp. ATCC BAA-442]
MYNQYEYFSRVKEVFSWTISSRSSTISLSISRKRTPVLSAPPVGNPSSAVLPWT